MAERNDRALRWLELGANIGIVCGLVLVAFQITQDRRIATESNDLGFYDVLNEQLRHISGEELATSLAKAISDPTKLTTKDYVALDAFYAGEMAGLIRREIILGSVSRGAVERWVKYLLGNPFGYAWWKSRPGVLDTAPKHRDAIDSLMTSKGPDHAHFVRNRYKTIGQIIASLDQQD